MTQEQNTATSAEEILRIKTVGYTFTDGGQVIEEAFDASLKAGDLKPYLSAMEEYHASKLKELSEKGEPSDEEIEEHAAGLYDDSPEGQDNQDSYCNGARWLRSELSPVIAALRAENENLTLEKIADNDLWQKDRVKISDQKREIASLRAQLETEPAEFAEWLAENEWMPAIKKHNKYYWSHKRNLNEATWKTTAFLRSDFIIAKGGKALRAQLESEGPIKEIMAYVVERQREYEVGSTAYNALRGLEQTLPNIIRAAYKSKGGKAHE